MLLVCPEWIPAGSYRNMRGAPPTSKRLRSLDSVANNFRALRIKAPKLWRLFKPKHSNLHEGSGFSIYYWGIFAR